MADAAYTLLDFESRATSQLQKGVIKTWREKSPILERLSFKKSVGLEIEILRTKDLPTATWLDFGEALPAMKGTTEPYKERVHKMGGKIDMPREYAAAQSIVDERANQESMALEAMAYNFNESFVNGNPVDNTKEIVGIRYRLVNLLSSTMSVSAASLDVSPNTATTTWANDLLDFLESIRDLFDDGNCDAFLADKKTIGRINAAMRRSGLLPETEDKVGKRYTTFGQGGPLLIPSGLAGDQSTAVIGHVENHDGDLGATNDGCTSIYALKFGEPYLSGFYLEDIRAEDKGELEDGVNVRTVVDWTPGIYMSHPRAIARGHTLIVA
jgi:hypothetical protein